MAMEISALPMSLCVPLLEFNHFMKMSTDIDQFSPVEKLATLTQLYLELRLPLQDALRAAEADL